MAKYKFKKSIFFEDYNSVKRFLFQIVNFGNEKRDELKFIFKHSKDDGAGVYKKSGIVFKKKTSSVITVK